MNFKGVIMYIASIAVSNINEVLATGGLIINLIYLGYQLHTHHKKNKQ
jgi:hypothetical protein